MLAQARAGTSAEIDLAFTIDTNRSLATTLHEVYLPRLGTRVVRYRSCGVSERK
ncbi:MAG: hypothetical protein JWR10_882 [Rubritepida sp.]|nr:hypothetical protein [Rubritepida sp.]